MPTYACEVFKYIVNEFIKSPKKWSDQNWTSLTGSYAYVSVNSSLASSERFTLPSEHSGGIVIRNNSYYG